MPYYSIFRGTTNDAVIELSEKLRKFFEPDGLTRAFYTSGSGDSVETVLRLARQYHKIGGEGGRVKYLLLKKGYHHTHTGGASVNGNANFRTQYEPLLPGCFHIPDLVADRDSKKPADKAVPARVQDLAYKAGAMVRVSGNNIILSPPLIVTSADVQVILGALEAGFAALT